MPNTLLIERSAQVTSICLNRPQVLNAINPEMQAELQTAFDAYAEDKTQRVCLIRGAGPRAFCAGSDLKAGARERGITYPRSGYGGLVERFDCFKPVVAVVHGLCLGGGFEIALACDLILAAADASFGLTEPKVGAIAVAGGIHRLVRQLGEKRAMGYLLTGARMSAAQAWQLGLVNEVALDGQLDTVVERWCSDLLAAAPIAVEATKEIAQRSLAEPNLQTALRRQRDYPGFKRWWDSEDVREGVLAFKEKREPVWRGR